MAATADPGTGDPATTFVISGKIADCGVGVPGIKIHVFGRDLDAQLVTDENGVWETLAPKDTVYLEDKFTVELDETSLPEGRTLMGGVLSMHGDVYWRGGIAWNVFDGPLLDLLRTFPDFVEAEKAGALRQAADVPALAALIGCDAATLAQTLAEVSPGRPDAFGRSFKRSLQAPFHAVKVTGALFHTQGGLDIGAQTRVLRQDGTPLPNLLAAGGAARGVSGQAVWGYLSGNGLLSAIAGGHIAAHTAQQLLKDTP